MKKLNAVLILLFLGLTFQAFSQTTPKDFFTGPWEITVFGTPEGDSKLTTTLTRINGKLTGELSNSATPTAPKIKIQEVVEERESISILFFAEGTEVNIDLVRKDDNNLEGTLMGMFTSKATRLAKP